MSPSTPPANSTPNKRNSDSSLLTSQILGGLLGAGVGGVVAYKSLRTPLGKKGIIDRAFEEYRLGTLLPKHLRHPFGVQYKRRNNAFTRSRYDRNNWIWPAALGTGITLAGAGGGAALATGIHNLLKPKSDYMHYLHDYANFSRNESRRRRPMPPPPPNPEYRYYEDGPPYYPPPRMVDRNGRPIPPPPPGYYDERRMPPPPPPPKPRSRPPRRGASSYEKAKLARSSVSTATRVSQETRGWARLMQDFLPLFGGG